VQGRFLRGRFGRRFQPFATGGDPAQTPFAVEGVVVRGLSINGSRPAGFAPTNET